MTEKSKGLPFWIIVRDRVRKWWTEDSGFAMFIGGMMGFFVAVLFIALIVFGSDNESTKSQRVINAINNCMAQDFSREECILIVTGE